LAELKTLVDQRLSFLLPGRDQKPESVHAAMFYALTGAGKRVRPILTLLTAEMFGEPTPAVLDLACTVEMVHACSLILDDLPMMDDAALRRGRPTTHMVFGDDVATLASFGLLNQAFALLVERCQGLSMERYTSEDLLHRMTESIGSRGLIGGQALDLEGRGQTLDLERMEHIHSHKTGALFIAAAELGGMAVDARRRELAAVTRFAKNLGLAFQITDDLLDVVASSEETGKDSGQDVDRLTFVKLLGVDGARSLAAELLDFAMTSLDPLGRRAEPLRLLAEMVRNRRK
jgi:geranylgeranyl diphosphate synthase type II